jgi:class 3 adenylate cyclase
VGSSPSQRKLAAILCADVAGYNRMMGADDALSIDHFIEQGVSRSFDGAH